VNSLQRPLAGYLINLSISESEDSSAKGFPEWQVNRVTLQLVAALFGQGASVIFGHDWRDDGVMEAVFAFARAMQPSLPVSSTDLVTEPTQLQNLLPWPDIRYLKQPELDRLDSTLSVKEVELPRDVCHLEVEARQGGPDTDIYRYVRARALTALRHRLTDKSHARVCFGGRRSGSQGRYPGIIEEALLSFRQRKPIFISCALGGAARQIIDAIEGRQMREDFCPTPLQGLYTRFQNRQLDAANPDCIVDRTGVWNEFSSIQPKVLANINGLSQQENEELFHTPVIDRVIELALTGLSRLRSPGNGVRREGS
jgi:hypothetical protein